MKISSVVVSIALAATSSAWPHLPINSTVPSASGSSPSSGLPPSNAPSGTGSKPGSIHVIGTGSHTYPTGTGNSQPPSGTGSNGLSTGGSKPGPTGTGSGGSPPVTIPIPPPTTITTGDVTSPTTKTHFITTTYTTTITKFIPQSTAVATQYGTTYYSSSLTTTLTTSTYVSVIPEYTVIVPAPGKGVERPAGPQKEGEVCPPPSTVYVTVTVQADGSRQTGAPGAPGNQQPNPQPPYGSNLPPYPIPSGSQSVPQGSGTAAPRPSGAGPNNPSGTGSVSAKLIASTY